MLRIYNSLGRILEAFIPRDPGEVGIYLCGPTVQSEPHVGHGRSAVAFDVIRRYLIWKGYDVTLVRNITDIEDKIIQASEESGIPVDQLAVTMAQRFREGYASLGVLEPDHEPKATQTIVEIIMMVRTLIERGLAYEAGGDVYFSVRSMEAYGKLSGRDPDDLRSGYRIEVDEAKHDPLDFALWKAAKPGEPAWDSQWGPGRPGWHIECSAMAEKYLGRGFDIHGGGTDLIFPHHENEIAQSEGATGEAFARYWLHNGMVNLGGEKMAKSTGLLVDLATPASKVGGRPLRFLLLRAHYRSPLDYTEALLDEAVEALERLDRFRARGSSGEPDPTVMQRFTEAMDDDFGTPQAVSLLFDAVRDGNRLLDEGGDASALLGAVEQIVSVLGIDEGSRPTVIDVDLSELAGQFGVFNADLDSTVALLIDRRNVARAEKRFDEADSIRSGLEAVGILLEDGPDGTRWLRS
ncbi:MAG TPA: cysteine--tRNA ligase [Acidimicrobiia bacterium]